MRKARSKGGRPITPKEADEQPDELPPLKALYKGIITFGAGVVFYLPKQTRLKDDYPGELGVYLCPNRDKGHTVLRMRDKKVLTQIRQLKVVPGSFPFRALGASEEQSEHALKGGGGTPEPESDVDERVDDQDDSPADESAKDATPTGSAERVVTHKYAKGDEVMTTQGQAVIDKVYPDGDLRVYWPGSSEPDAMYTVSHEDVWLVEDYPDEIYDSYGHKVSEISQTAKNGPNSLIQQLPADEIDKMLPRTKAQEDKCPRELLELVNEAKFVEWQTLLRKGCYSELMELPPGKRALRHVWALRAKPDSVGMTEKIKARCALDGSRDKHDVPKWDAYSPVANIHTLRVLIATNIADREVRLWQIDIVCAYLAAPMKKEVYAYPPDGFRSPETPRHVLKVLRALYGGADSGRCYYDLWNEVHTSMGFQPIHHDSCYLQYVEQDGSFIRFCYHVDDGVYAQKGDTLWQWYLTELNKHFETKVQPLSYCLGIQFHIDYDEGIVHMEQAGAIEKMLRAFGLDGECTKSVHTPVLASYTPSEKDAVPHSAKDKSLASASACSQR